METPQSTKYQNKPVGVRPAIGRNIERRGTNLRSDRLGVHRRRRQWRGHGPIGYRSIAPRV
jgi:hypothetical protein